MALKALNTTSIRMCRRAPLTRSFFISLLLQITCSITFVESFNIWRQELSSINFSPTSSLSPHGASQLTSSTMTMTTRLWAMKKSGKFNKQKDLAEKMEVAKRQRQQAAESMEGSSATKMSLSTTSSSVKNLTKEDIELRNDRQRFADLLDSSMNQFEGIEAGYYLTVEQEEENANAVYRGILRLYEGDPAPSTPFAELIDMQSGQPIGKSGMCRVIPWEGSNNNSNDYIVVITDPRPKSVELRSAIRNLCSGGGSLGIEILKRCVIINSDTPGENRRFMKKSFGESMPGSTAADALTVLSDENLEWMREYTALGEKRFSMTMFVLSEGRCQKIAREMDPDLICNAVKNAILSMKN